MKPSTCIYLTRTFPKFYSTNPTLKALIQSRNDQYITKLPSTKKTTHLTQQVSFDELVLPKLDDIRTLHLLSGEDSNSISPRDPKFSILLNKCLSDALDNPKLRRLQSIESFYTIFKKYQNECININGVIYYDLNKLCQYFISCKQLSKAQLVLEFLFKSNAPKNNILFLTNYLNLRCGSDIDLWNYKKYKILDYMTISQLSHEIGKSKYLNKQIIQSFGYMKNISNLEHYIESLWGISLHGNKEESVKTANLNTKDLLYPTNGILLSIMSSYYYIDGNISRAFAILDLFLKKYPDIKLDHKFWYPFLKNCVTLSLDKDDSNVTQIWNAMKLWYGTDPIPFNREVLTLVYAVLKRNNNLYYTNDIYNHCIGPFVSKNPDISSLEMNTVTIYQKYIIRKHIDKKHMRLALNFINQSSISLSNKEDLLQFYAKRTNIRKKKPIQSGYDDSDEDDGIFTPLW